MTAGLPLPLWMRYGDVVVAYAQQALAPAEAGYLPHLVLGEIEDILYEACLLFLHLHDELYAA